MSTFDKVMLSILEDISIFRFFYPIISMLTAPVAYFCFSYFNLEHYIPISNFAQSMSQFTSHRIMFTHEVNMVTMLVLFFILFMIFILKPSSYITKIHLKKHLEFLQQREKEAGEPVPEKYKVVLLSGFIFILLFVYVYFAVFSSSAGIYDVRPLWEMHEYLIVITMTAFHCFILYVYIAFLSSTKLWSIL